MEAELEGLLAGPRGRRFLAELAERLVGSEDLYRAGAAWWGPAWDRDSSDDLPAALVTACLRRLQDLLAQADLEAVAAARDPHALLASLGASVDAARYWQDPDAVDGILSEDRARALLRPLAAAVLSAPAAAWWREDVDYRSQQHVTWVRQREDLQTPAPALTGGFEALRTWSAEERHREAADRDERPRDARASFSGHWWSTPAMIAGVVDTSPAVRAPAVTQVLPVGLSLVEDSIGALEALVHPLRPNPSARVLEIHNAQAWCDLVAAHPREATWSRRHDWWRSTGWAGSWALPDWTSVAHRWDGVHLSVVGYLTTSGRLLSTTVPGSTADDLSPGPAHTLLAGWDPGQTWWLTDVLEPAGVPQRWIADRHDDLLRWSQR